jgi:hypothetical protein
MENVLPFLLNAFAASGALALAFGAYIVAEALYYQIILGPGLERDLGFRHGVACLPNHGARGYVSAVAIDSVNEGGVFQQVGFRDGDVLPDVSHSTLFKLLHRRRGRMAELAVVDGGPGPDFYGRPRKVLRFAVPSRNRQSWRGRRR